MWSTGILHLGVMLNDSNVNHIARRDSTHNEEARMTLSGLPNIPDSAEDFLIFRGNPNKSIWIHKFDSLPDSDFFFSIK